MTWLIVTEGASYLQNLTIKSGYAFENFLIAERAQQKNISADRYESPKNSTSKSLFIKGCVI